MPLSPTISFNLGGLNDYNSATPFIDLMRTSRPVFVHEPTSWGGMENHELKAMGALDANGYLTHIPSGGTRAGTIFDWDPNDGNGNYRKGIYEFTYEGKADFHIYGARIISQEPGRIVLEMTSGGPVGFDWDNIEAGNHPRDFHLVKQENLGLFEAGAIFDPKWIEIIQDVRDFRFMDFMSTNESDVVSWSERRTLASATWSGGSGGPVEVMVELANLTGVNPWFTFPHKADESYIRGLAEYVRDNLDPRLEARFEYSNEAWNFAFRQTQWLLEKSKEEWGSDRWYDYHVMKATKAALLVDEVFSQADGPAASPVHVLGTHTGNPWITHQLLVAETWKAQDPDGYVDPKTVFDEVGVTSYFGGFEILNEDIRDQLLHQIQTNPSGAADWLKGKLMDPNYPGSIPGLEKIIAEQDAIIEAAGLKMVAYEGGQHVHHLFATGVPESELTVIGPWLAEFVRSEQMADLYVELAEMWSRHGDGAFMQFGSVGRVSKWGSWDLLSHMLDDNPRARAFFGEIADMPVWWEDATAGKQYLNGKVFAGTTASEKIVGTNQEDNLAGMAGNDVFLLRGGNDKVSGGNGNDVFITGRGTDHIVGGAGVDRVEMKEAAAGVTVNLSSGRLGDGRVAGVENVIGSAFADNLTGDGGINVIKGAKGNDTINGGGGNDDLMGNRGNDLISGGGGNDRIVGGRGNDVMTGGSGADVFVFGKRSGADQVTDFEFGVDSVSVSNEDVSWTAHSSGSGAVMTHEGGTVHFETLTSAQLQQLIADPTLLF